MTTSAPRLFRWRQRNSAERFEAMTLGSVGFFFVMGLTGALATITTSRVWYEGWGLSFVVLAVAHAALGFHVFRSGLLAMRGRSRPDWRRLAVLVLLSAAMCAVAVIRYQPPEFDVGLTWGLLVPAVGLMVAISPLPPLRYLVLLALAIVPVLMGLLAIARAPTGQVIGMGISGTMVLLAMALSCRASAWMMSVVWELDDARAVAGRLAVAEERLRFSRDLHDVFGRTLSTVAVKSELAAALAERGDPRGAAEMLEVRRIAHEALREVRGVVQGYRAADLDTEMAGARELLRSAGIQCRVAGEGLALPEQVAQAIAWVIREAVTNVVRHSEAVRCDIEVRAEPSQYRVVVTNDGAPSPARDAEPGNGLPGLRERLQARGGAVTTRSQDGVFVLEALLPRADDADHEEGS